MLQDFFCQVLFYIRVCKQLKYSTATNKKSTQQLKYLLFYFSHKKLSYYLTENSTYISPLYIREGKRTVFVMIRYVHPSIDFFI